MTFIYEDRSSLDVVLGSSVTSFQAKTRKDVNFSTLIDLRDFVSLISLEMGMLSCF